MRQFNQKLLLISLFTFTISSQVFASGAQLPVLDTGSASTPTDTTAGSGTANQIPSTPTTGAYVDQIKQIAANSSCINYNFSGRGQAPAGYIKGVAISFARSLCRLKNQSTLSQIMSAANTNNDAKDALTHYQSSLSNLSIQISAAGTEPLRALYTLGIGLGMRESSGTYCEGWDKSAGSNRSSAAGEAGLFQTSYDSMAASSELSKLYAEYQATPGRCLLDVFKQGASCSDLSNLGSGAGATYQAFNKACPAFATEYAMTMLRIQRSHYGPINRQEAQVVPACNTMLKQVQDLVEGDAYACTDLQ
jgi:hypothetical protein